MYHLQGVYINCQKLFLCNVTDTTVTTVHSLTHFGYSLWVFLTSFLQIQTSTHLSRCQGQAALSQQGEKFPVVKRRKFTGRK